MCCKSGAAMTRSEGRIPKDRKKAEIRSPKNEPSRINSDSGEREPVLIRGPELGVFLGNCRTRSGEAEKSLSRGAARDCIRFGVHGHKGKHPIGHVVAYV